MHAIIRAMCLITFAWDVHPRHALVLAANRDEYHARPAAPLGWWQELPILGGRDLQEDGGWLAASRDGRFAAVTNVRGPDAAVRRPRSRGRLVAEFLTARGSGLDYGRRIAPDAAEFGGFNLLLFDGARLAYLTNRPSFAMREIEPGVHGLSNAQLDTPWPKVRFAGAALEGWLAGGLDDERGMLEAMGSPARAPDAALPSTGVSLEMERALSPAFIRMPVYGTRCTTLVRVGRDGGEVSLFERRYDAEGAISGESRAAFVPGPAA